MKKLLNKPLQAFTFYALFTLGMSIPVYYWVVNTIWLKELDEHNQITKYHLQQGLLAIDKQTKFANLNLKVWNTLQPNTQIVPVAIMPSKSDSCFTISRGNWHGTKYEIDRFRGLITYIKTPTRIYQITIETNVEEADEIIYAISVVSFIFFVLLVVGFIKLNRWIGFNTWQPFQYTLTQLKIFDVSAEQTVNFQKTDIIEFEELHQVLYKMIEKAQASYQQQKMFIENASHELQTPLALLRSKIDLLYQDTNLTIEQAKILEALERPLARASRINKNLLLLAKIENNQFVQQETMALHEIITDCITLLQDYIENKHLVLKSKIATDLRLEGNKFLIEILFNNLLTNAIRHTLPEGLIEITSTNKGIQIRNTGVAKLQDSQLFKRFAQTSADHASGGLGLSIVHEICLKYKWHITYTFSDNFHVFNIEF